MSKIVEGFSKLTKKEKIDWVVSNHFKEPEKAKEIILSYNHQKKSVQKVHDEFIENSLSNLFLPFGVAPNFLINNRLYTVPMAIEESSVIAAASKTAKFWSSRGGFNCSILSKEKVGQIHFLFYGNSKNLTSFFNDQKKDLVNSTNQITINMRSRGGGIKKINLIDKTSLIKNYYQIHVVFETIDSMGANFINSCLEQIAKSFKLKIDGDKNFSDKDKKIDIVMSIMSNYVPNCLARAQVRCPIKKLGNQNGMKPKYFSKKIIQAIEIAENEPYRAVTHNKGIMNGVDAVLIATGNDFRAVEAGIHSYAARNGKYSSLTFAYEEKDDFIFEIKIPIAIGTVGGLTSIHPLVKWSLELLGNPSSSELMQIIAAVGLSQNFGALRSLVTSGIQIGHMKMHLLNILNQNNATQKQKIKAIEFFKNKLVNHNEVKNFLKSN